MVHITNGICEHTKFEHSISRNGNIYSHGISMYDTSEHGISKHGISEHGNRITVH